MFWADSISKKHKMLADIDEQDFMNKLLIYLKWEEEIWIFTQVILVR